MTPAKSSNHYSTQYDSKRRFISYWHQIDEIMKCSPKSILEIGVGNGFLSKYLRDHNIATTTCDIDPALSPDYIAPVSKLPFENSVFDVVVAFQVLEHSPYEKFLTSIQEMKRVAKDTIIISIPDARRAIRLEFPLPKYGKVKKLFTLPQYIHQVHTLTPEGHFWEIGKKGYSLNRILNDLLSTGLIIKKEYRVFEIPYHHFFVLEKKHE